MPYGKLNTPVKVLLLLLLLLLLLDPMQATFAPYCFLSCFGVLVLADRKLGGLELNAFLSCLFVSAVDEINEVDASTDECLKREGGVGMGNCEVEPSDECSILLSV